MVVGARRVRRRLAQAALLAVVLTGCSGVAQDDPKTPSSASAAAEAARADETASGGDTAVKSGGTIGAAGSACELPVTFDIAEDWKAEAVDGGDGSGEADSELAQEIADALLHQGPVTATCEIDAKPAGNIGFLRIWKGKAGDDDARAVLEGFVKAEKGVSKAKYSAFEAGGLTGAEVNYLVTSELLDETKEESALAVATKQGPVVIHLGGMDTDEHRAMLPAYELAKRTLRAG
ncbi:hypothetical protein IM697_25010 [Streptomyces ferrugineus]|uniref:Lipoprotein n=1 Tax=Streptomyces ferrugineus TaxID=1413221 RepID=A0A7M2SBR9_9ACTN|nr:lipoprotein [Streptomyces ferrugineus]QOV33469.1 hypothetical protein IM697_25010 [Streptomyces ferrugineus]